MSNMRNFFRPNEYLKPTSVADVVELLDKHGQKATVIAAGTDILVEKDPCIEILIDITDLGLDCIKSNAQGVQIGAATTFAGILASSDLDKEPYTVLVEAARQMGTPQLRNMATIGGNICSAVPSADSAPALLVLDATLTITGPNGERQMPISDFFKGARENALGKGEVLTEIRLPTFPGRTGAVFAKKGRVATGDLAIVNAAVRLTMNDDNICQDARIALGAAAPTPLRLKELEAMLNGQKPQDELLADIAAQASNQIKPISDVRGSAQYRMILSSILVEQALREVVGKIAT